jgi:hypothetical protein
MTVHAREFLSASTRRGRDALEADDEPAAKLPARDPGKRSDEDELGPPPRAPGKRSRAGDGTAQMSPAQAVAFAEWMTRAHRIDRRAETAIADEAGALSAAFAFLADARGGQPLPDELRRQLERELGISLAAVRVHSNDQAAAALGARAFTIGDDIYFAAGAYDPTSEVGQALIAHEVAHVAQHRLGGAPTARRLSRPDDAHERDAERFASRFAALRAPGPGDDPARLVEHARRHGRRIELPFRADLEQRFGTSFDFVEAYTGHAAELACQALSATAFVVQNLVMLASPSPRRGLLRHELTHVLQLGKRTAPERFAPGTLTVSDRGDPAEVEARRGGSIQATGSPSTIYRGGDENDDDDDDTSSPAEKLTKQQARIKQFVDNAPREDYPQSLEGYNGNVYAFGTPTADETLVYRYQRSSPQPWKLEDYAYILDAAPSLKKSSRTYQRDIAAMVDSGDTYKVAKVNDRGNPPEGDDSKAKRYAFIEDDGKYVPVVWYIHPDAARRADPLSRMKAYRNVVIKLQALPTKRIVKFKYQSDQQLTERDIPLSNLEADAYLKSLQTAIVDEYAALGSPWNAFYDEVINSDVFPISLHAILGSIFEDLVKQTCGLTLEDQRPIFVFNEGTKEEYRCIGDASYQGDTIVDAKATTEGIKDSLATLQEYELITRPSIPDAQRIKGYFKSANSKPAVRRVYRGVLYIVATEAAADLVASQIENAFPDDHGLWQRFSIIPVPPNHKQFDINFNPTIRLQAEDRGGTSYTFTDPPSGVPGVSVQTAEITLDPATNQIAAGSLEMDLDLGGAFTSESVTKTVTPAQSDGDGVPTGQVDNRFTNFSSSLGQILSAVTVDAHLIDGGIEASIALQPGAVQIPQFTLSAASLTARYTEAGLAISGDLAISHTSGKITGRVALDWDGGCRFSGALQVAGLIQGLAPFEVDMDYAGPDDWRVGLAAGSSLSVSTQLLGVPVSGVIDQLEMGSANRLSTAADGASGSQTGFSASGSLTADLPLIGSVEAGIRIVNNQLDTLSLTAERDFVFPAANPIVSGSVTGSATYHVQTGVLDGGLSGTASITVPGIAQPADITFALAAGQTGLTVNASLVNPVEINRFLRLTSLSATYANGQLTLVGGAAVQNLGNVNASIGVRVDQTGIHVEDGSASITFGDASFGGGATFRYSEKDGFGFDGYLDVEVLPGKTVRLSIAYPSTDGSGVAEQGTFDAKVAIPSPDGGGEGMTAAGWQLWDGVQPAAPTPLFSAPHITIPIFSIGLATATIEIDAALLYTLAVDPLTVAGSLEVDGIDLANPQQPFRKIAVTGTAKSGITGQLIFKPSVALGLSVVHPFLAGIRGGLELPVTATAGLDIAGDVALEFQPGKGLDTKAATVTAPLSFSVVATPRLFAQLTALGGIISPPAWQSDDLAELTVFQDKKLLEVIFDLAHPDRGITVNTFNPTAPASSSPTGMPMTPRAPTTTAGSQSAASLANNAAVSTTSSNPAGTPSGGGMDFTALLNAVSSAMPKPVQQVITTLQSIWTTIQPIVQKVIDFLNWISDRIRSIFADDEVQALLTQVLPELASGNASNIVDAVKTALDIGRTVVQKLVAPLVQSGDVSVLRRRKDRGIFGWDEGDPDVYSYRFHIPGLLDVSGEGSDPALSAMVLLLRDQLGVPIRDLDDVQPPHMIGYYADFNATGDIIGSSTDDPQTLRGGDDFHHDCMSSVKGYGVTPGTTLHLYEHPDSGGDYARITFGSAPAPAPTVDANGLEQRKPPTITVNIDSGGDHATWAVIRGTQLNDKISTVVITRSTEEPGR